LIAHLADSVRALAAAGDLPAARVATDALAALLREAPGAPATVLDLGEERARRT
jgi:hypothetical protein